MNKVFVFKYYLYDKVEEIGQTSYGHLSETPKYVVLDKIKKELVVYREEDFVKLCETEDIDGVFELDEDLKFEVVLETEYTETDKARLRLLEPLRVTGTAEGLNVYYVKDCKTFKIENDLLFYDKKCVNAKRTKVHYMTSDINLLIFNQTFIDLITENLKEVKKIIGNRKLQIYNHILFSGEQWIEDDILDFSKVDLPMTRTFENNRVNLRANQVIFYKLDLSKLEGWFYPVGFRNHIKVVNFKHCYNDLSDYFSLDYSAFDRPFQLHMEDNDLFIVIVNKECERFKQALLLSNELIDKGLSTEEDIQNFLSKHILLKKTGRYLFTI